MSVINFLFGLGIFLFGMSELETGIGRLGDARLKQMLRASTNSRFSSISVGVFTTAILQSSSMVSLLVLAFAGAGLVPLVNAIGILLGANLGTTATGWIVATLGFKLDLEAIAIPLVGSAAFLLVLLQEKSKLHAVARLFLGLGMLLFGLSLMKSSMETLPEQWNVSNLSGQWLVVYLLLGIVVTFLVQSSSAVMMMALTALSSQLIGLQEAAALVIGADLGTTSTTILGSLRGSVIKRKLAFAHVAFNLIVDTAAFLILLPLLPQLLSLLRISDPLYGLVAFHSTMNFLGLIVFIPFLEVYSNWIDRLFDKSKLQAQDILERVPTTITDAALAAVYNKAVVMELQAISNAMRLFGLHPERNITLSEIAEKYSSTLQYKSFRQGYEDLKGNESAVSQYVLKMQLQPLSEEQARELESCSRVIRLLVYSNKTLKDITHDLDELEQVDEVSLKEFYKKQRDYQRSTFECLIELLRGQLGLALILEELRDLDLRNNEHYANMNQSVYRAASKSHLDGMALSMQLNVNHEIHHAAKNLIQSLRELVSTNSWEQIAAVGIPA